MEEQVKVPEVGGDAADSHAGGGQRDACLDYEMGALGDVEEGADDGQVEEQVDVLEVGGDAAVSNSGEGQRDAGLDYEIGATRKLDPDAIEFLLKKNMTFSPGNRAAAPESYFKKWHAEGIQLGKIPEGVTHSGCRSRVRDMIKMGLIKPLLNPD